MIKIDKNQKTITIIKPLLQEDCVSPANLPFVDAFEVLDRLNGLIKNAVSEEIGRIAKALFEKTIVHVDEATVVVRDDKRHMEVLSILLYNELYEFQAELCTKEVTNSAEMLLHTTSSFRIASVFKAIVNYKARRKEAVPPELQHVFIDLLMYSSLSERDRTTCI